MLSERPGKVSTGALPEVADRLVTAVVDTKGVEQFVHQAIGTSHDATRIISDWNTGFRDLHVNTFWRKQ